MCYFGMVMPLAGLNKDELLYKPDNLEFVLRLVELGVEDLQDRTRTLASMNAPMKFSTYAGARTRKKPLEHEFRSIFSIAGRGFRLFHWC